MTNTNKTTAPKTLTELKAWTKEARNWVEYLHGYMPTGHQEAFGSITNRIYNCLDCLTEMFDNDGLELVEYTIDPQETMIDDNQANEMAQYNELMAQYNELMKEVEDSDKEAREIAYGDTIDKYIDKRAKQLKEQATFDELVDKVALYESELLDYAERLLSDDPLIADSETAIGTLEMLDNEAIDLFKSLDIDNEYQGLEYYDTSLNKED